MVRDKILFIGELPPKSVHGISISNAINVKLLEESNIVDVVEELYLPDSHNSFSFQKICSLLKRLLKIACLSLVNKYAYLYTIQSFSLFGSIKSFFQVFSFKLFSKGKIILHLHRSDFKRLTSNSISSYFFKYNLRNSSKIIVLSNSIKKQLANIEGGISKKIFTLNNTIEFEDIINNSSRVFNKNYFTFVYFSNYIKEKGIFEVINAFEKLSVNNDNVRLLCYGNYVDNQVVKELHLLKNERILINGPVTNNFEKTKIFLNADCLLLASYNEGKPLVLLEAMACGLPIITTSVGFISEILPPGYEYAYSVTDSNALYSKMLQMLNDEKRYELSKMLEVFYQANFSKELHRKELFEIINYEG